MTQVTGFLSPTWGSWIVTGSWVWPWPILAVAGIWRVNYLMGALFTVSGSQINEFKFILVQENFKTSFPHKTFKDPSNA